MADLELQVSVPKRAQQGRDLFPSPLGAQSWKEEDAEKSLARIYCHVRADALGAIDWYVRRRRPKAWFASTSRWIALLAGGVAALLPLVDGLAQFSISGLWVSIAIAVGGGALALDRYLDAGSGWVRYVKADLQIRNALELFEMEWETRRARWEGRPPSPGEVAGMLEMAKGFATGINTIVQEETNAWAEWFQSSVQQIDKALEARAAESTALTEAAKTGAVNIVVTNGDQCDNGWSLIVEGREVRRSTSGRTAALVGLPPGMRTFEVTGSIGGLPKRGERASAVPLSGASEVTITLE